MEDYWQLLSGKILRSMIVDGARTVEEIMMLVDIPRNELNVKLLELIGRGIINIEIDEQNIERYYVLPEIVEEYTERRVFIQEDTPKQSHVEWIMRWIDEQNIDVSKDISHFFLERGNLTEFIRKIVGRSHTSIMVTNPFIDETNISISLRDASTRGVNVVIMTRASTDTVRKEFHDTMIKSNIEIVYSGGNNYGPHAKVIVVDDEVSVISSMNMIPTAESGKSWEAGIVTIDEQIVKSIKVSMKKFYDDVNV